MPGDDTGWAGWFCPRCRDLHGLGLVPLLDPVLVFASLLCGQDSFLFFSSHPTSTLAICLPVFAVGLKHEGLWADRYKPIPIVGGHVAVFPPPGLLWASLSSSSPAPAQLSLAACGISGLAAGI